MSWGPSSAAVTAEPLQGGLPRHRYRNRAASSMLFLRGAGSGRHATHLASDRHVLCLDCKLWPLADFVFGAEQEHAGCPSASPGQGRHTLVCRHVLHPPAPECCWCLCAYPKQPCMWSMRACCFPAGSSAADQVGAAEFADAALYPTWSPQPLAVSCHPSTLGTCPLAATLLATDQVGGCSVSSTCRGR